MLAFFPKNPSKIATFLVMVAINVLCITTIFIVAWMFTTEPREYLNLIAMFVGMFFLEVFMAFLNFWRERKVLIISFILLVGSLVGFGGMFLAEMYTVTLPPYTAFLDDLGTVVLATESGSWSVWKNDPVFHGNLKLDYTPRVFEFSRTVVDETTDKPVLRYTIKIQRRGSIPHALKEIQWLNETSHDSPEQGIECMILEFEQVHGNEMIAEFAGVDPASIQGQRNFLAFLRQHLAMKLESRGMSIVSASFS